MDRLKKYRCELDIIDDQIIDLLNARMVVAGKLAAIKSELNLSTHAEKREKEIIMRVKKRARNGLLKENVEQIFRALFSLAKKLACLAKAESSPYKSVGVIGLGVMGGSIIKAVKAASEEVSIATLATKSSDFNRILRSGLIDAAYDNINDLINNAELIVLALPVSYIAEYAEKIGVLARKPITIIDIAGVKGKICRSFQRLTNPKAEFIASHPMSGNEKKGFAHSRGDLFINAPWIITPHKKNRRRSIKKIKKFISFLGAFTKIMDPEEHDKKIALVSHVPEIAAKSYLDFTKKVCPDFAELQGSGFISFTRIARGNPETRKEVILYNKKAIYDILDKWGLKLP